SRAKAKKGGINMIQREIYMQQIRPFIDKNIVKILTGMRRAGKSIMLDLIKQELQEKGIEQTRILSINFESKMYDFTRSEDETYNFVKNFVQKNNSKTYIFFDEIQELPGFEKLVNSCLIDFDCDIYLTGSNANLLSSEFATYLAGRYVEFKIYPFSYGEVIDFYHQQGGDVDKNEVFNQYILKGGMPFIYEAQLDENSAMQYLQDIYDSIIVKDIATRNSIRDIDLLKRILQYFILNIGNTFSASNIIKYLKNEQRKISSETIYNYISYCKTACLLQTVARDDIIGKEILKFQEKIYLTDHGVRQALFGDNMAQINAVLENIVYVELLRRGYEVTIGKNGNKEVDFIAKKGKEKCYIQVSYLLASEETVEREFSVLESIDDNFPKYVVSMDEINRGRNGIENINIKKFLLMEKY
ncbi:MAG: ATP-binding protein, partial [Oscillospiraceae bacterium]